MKKMKLLGILMILISINLNAQKSIEIGFGAYWGTAKLQPCDSDEDDCWIDTDVTDISLKTGLQGSIGINFQINEMFSFMPGVSIAKKGFKYNQDDEEGFFNMNYIDIPLLVKAQFPIKEKLKFYAVVGPTIGFSLGANLTGIDEYYDNGEIVERPYVYGLAVGDDIELTGYSGIKNTNLSLLFKGGVTMETNKGYLFADIGFEAGLSDFILLTGDVNKGALRGTILSIGYGFNLATATE